MYRIRYIAIEIGKS